MLPLLLVVLLAVEIIYWSLLPLVHLATPLLKLGWLGWLVLAGIAWLLAGS